MLLDSVKTLSKLELQTYFNKTVVFTNCICDSRLDTVSENDKTITETKFTQPLSSNNLSIILYPFEILLIKHTPYLIEPDR